jgi:hypothetical protein
MNMFFFWGNPIRSSSRFIEFYALDRKTNKAKEGRIHVDIKTFR